MIMKTVLFSFVLLGLTLSSNGQSGYVRDAMYEKYGQPGAEKGADWMKNMMSGKVEPEYKFPVMVQMHTTSYKNGTKKDEMDMTYYLNSATNQFAMKMVEEKKRKKNEEMLIIYDYKSNSMIMLNETEKTGMAMNLNAFMSGENIKKREQGAGAASNDKGTTSCKKTGKSKMIRGYSCDEYICTDSERDTRSEVWVTNKLSFDIAQPNSRGPLAAYLGGAKGLGGMMMEGNFYKNDELEMKMETMDLNNAANKLVSTKDYDFPMR